MSEITIPSYLAERVTRLAAEYTDSTEARADARAAEAELLTAFIDLVRPAIGSLASRIPISYWSRLSLGGEERRTHHPERGLLLGGTGAERGGPEESRTHRDATDGSYTGSNLYLLRDGQLAIVTYSGTWSRWQNSVSEYEATFSVVAPAEALKLVAVDKIIAAVVSAIVRAGSRAEATAAARARAAQCRALATLIGGGR